MGADGVACSGGIYQLRGKEVSPLEHPGQIGQIDPQVYQAP